MTEPYPDPEKFLRTVDDEAQAPQPNGAAGDDGVSARRFTPVRFCDVTLGTEPPYLIKGLIPREGLVVAWGPPKCGKSFWSFDVAMHIALGRPYRDRPAQRGAVLYIACEGERGLAARIEAFRQTRLADGDDPRFWLLTSRLDLVADIKTLIGDIRDVLGATLPVLIVVDTLNRSLAGSESRDEDMAADVGATDQLREAFRAAVLLIHHCGHNGDRPRGHSTLSAAADAQIAVKRDSFDHILATVEFMKDGPEGDVIASCLSVVEIGEDEDGDMLSSCIIEPVEPPAFSRAPKPKGLSAPAKVALGTLRKAIDEAGEAPPGCNHIPGHVRVVPVETWRRYHYTGTASDDQTIEARKKAFQSRRS